MEPIHDPRRFLERGSRWRIKPGTNPDYTDDVVIWSSHPAAYTKYRRLDNGTIVDIPTVTFLKHFEEVPV